MEEHGLWAREVESTRPTVLSCGPAQGIHPVPLPALLATGSAKCRAVAEQT